MSQKRRSLVRRRKTQGKRRKSNGRSRLLSPERLEERTLLAGDLLASGMTPWQNPFLPTDVNYDLETTALDALILINSLNQSGSHSLASTSVGAGLSGGDSEGETGTNSQFMDVNGDSFLTPLDVLDVINTINNAEGEGQTITFLHSLTDLNGDPLPDLDNDGIPEIIAGQEGIYQLRGRDSRSPRFGIFSSYLNLDFVQGLITTAYQEVQTATINAAANGGSFTLQWGAGPGSVSSEIDVGSDYQFNQQTQEWKAQAGLLSVSSGERAAMVQAAVESITGLDATNVEVAQTAYLTYDITFTGNLANGDVTNMVAQEVAGKELRSGMDIDGVGTDIPGNPVNVIERIAADPDSNPSFLSAANSAANLAIGAENRTYTFAFQGFLDKQGPTPGLNNIGATARLIQVGNTFEIDWAPGWGPGSTHLIYAVRFMADNAGRLTFTLGPPVAAPGDNDTPDEVTVWPSPQAQQGAQLNLFPLRMGEVEFPVALDLDIVELATAVDDTAPTPPALILEDSGQTFINVLANDTVASGTPTLESIVTQPAPGEGTAGVVGSQAAYQTSANFAGQTTFVYQMSDGGVNTDNGTVTVDVTPVNDAPEFTPQSSTITIDEDAGAQTVNNWATGIRPGPATAVDEAQQVLTFNETLVPGGGNLQAADFVSLPSVDETTGALTFEVAPNVNGEAVVAITLSDDGGTANGGVDTSAAHTLTITVDPINDAPVNSVPGAQTVDTDNLPLVFSTANGNEISVDDPEDKPHAPGGDVTVEVKFSVDFGTLTVTNTGGLDSVTNNNSPTVTIRGTTAAVNTTLASSLEYTGPVGPDTLTVTTDDLGNEDKNGASAFLTDTDTVAINVVPPTRPFASGDQETVNEDSGATVIDVLANDYDVNSSQPPGPTVTIKGVVQPPAGEGTVTIAPDERSVTYTTDQDFNGTTTFTYTIEDTITPNDGPSIGTVTVTVNQVNDAPTFAAVDPPQVNEDAGPQSVAWAAFNAGAPHEAGQSALQYTVQNVSNPNLFAAGPLVATDGTLTYTPAADANGSSTFDVLVQDDGGTDFGGNDTSTAQEFTITVNAVNDAPTFTVSQPAAVNEDSGAQSVALATNFDPGPDDEENEPQSLVGYTVANVSNPGLFAAGPAVALDGTLTYTPAPEANGTSTFELTAQDDGGTALGGVDTSAVHSVTITVNPVNDTPAFTANDPAAVNEDAGPQSIANWASNFDPGPANENSQQVLQYNVNVVENPGLFATGPTVATNGTLSYETALHQYGEAKFTVAVQDDGGTPFGGSDTSPNQTFTLTVNSVNDAPVNLINGDHDFSANDQSTDDNVDLPLNAQNGNLLTVTDVDHNGADTYQTDLMITNGTLSLGTPPAGVTVTDVNGDGTHLRITCTVAEINDTLDALVYSPTPNFIGEGVLTITTRDGGASGAGGEKTDTDSLTITVAPFNDPPDAVDDNVTTAEGAATTFNVIAGAGADSAGPNENAFQDIDVVGFDTTGTVGTVQLLNAETGEFSYTPPDSDFFGQTTFIYTIQDDGQSRINGVIQDDFKTDDATVTITVTEVNDNPVAADDLQLIPPFPQQGEEHRFPVGDVLINDLPGPPNENGQTLRVIAVGVSTKGVNVWLDDKGTPNDFTDDEIVYTVPAGFDHVDDFTVTISDNGTTAGQLDEKTNQATVTVRDVVPSNVTGYVFDDLNGNGRKDAGEPGIGGVKIELDGQSLVPNSPLVHEETLTDENGYYEFRGVLPNMAGFSYTITEWQPAQFADGDEWAWADPQDANDVEEATDAIPANDEISVALPLLGYQDGGNDNNNFGEMGLVSELSSVDYRDLLNSDGQQNGIMDMGLMFAVDANGNLQWKVNVGGWKYQSPGVVSASGVYENAAVTATNGKSLRITDTKTGQVHVITLGDRVRWKAAGTSTVYRIFGAADDFGLDVYSAATPGGEGEAITEDQTVEMLAAAGDAAQYAAAVDAAFAEAAEMSA